jgi:dihydrofolate reductase
MLTLIVARSLNGAIGKDNRIPWELPEDLAFFQRETLGGAIIMGRRTWESLPVRPLRNRLNCVVSSVEQGSVKTFPKPMRAVRFCYEQGYRRIYGIGGESIYRELLPVSARLLVTEVGLNIEGADAFFPTIDKDDWTELGSFSLRASGPQAVAHELLRRRAAESMNISA